MILTGISYKKKGCFPSERVFAEVSDLHEYAQGYSASDIISHLQSEHLLSEFSTAKKIRIDNGTYIDARLLTLKRGCLTEYEDSD